MSLQDLPAEILLMCLQEFNRPLQPYRFSALANIRLTCKRYAGLVIPLLFSEITVQFSSTHLQRLKKLCENPMIAGSITHVRIALACHDPAMLDDFPLFVFSRAETIDALFMLSRCDPTSAKIYEEIEKEVARVSSIWTAIGEGNENVDSFDQNLKLLKKSHQNYKKLYRDQREHKPVTLLSEILKRLNHLQQISISDYVLQVGRIDEKGALDLAWDSGYIPAGKWYGSKFGPSTATPWTLIADIFDAMDMSSVHPAKFELNLQNALLHSRAFRISPECLVRISDVLRDTKSIRILIETISEDCDDTGFVGQLTKCLCDVASLQELQLSFSFFDSYHPATSVLPLGKTTWENLKSLKLQYIALSREEFQMLLKQCNKDVLEDVQLYDLTPRSLSRQDACDDLKSFKKVRKIAWSDIGCFGFDLEYPLWEFADVHA
ncbi:hypothetical protein DTO271D3_7179 [Paecilomyces variotii]|nr:hypothetical protein DTO271D3_7179 [Paecilomyces variotii]